MTVHGDDGTDELKNNKEIMKKFICHKGSTSIHGVKNIYKSRIQYSCMFERKFLYEKIISKKNKTKKIELSRFFVSLKNKKNKLETSFPPLGLLMVFF